MNQIYNIQKFRLKNDIWKPSYKNVEKEKDYYLIFLIPLQE